MPVSDHYEYTVEAESAGQRLDVYLTAKPEPDISRSQTKKRLQRGEISVNGESVKAGYSLKTGDHIKWEFLEPTEPDLKPQDLGLDLLHEDEHLAVVDKPAGMVVHPGPGHPDGTLVNGLLDRLDELSGVGGEKRPGLVHRLDKDTSGALVVAKTDEAHHHLAAQFKDHSIRRRYHALVFGPGLESSGTFRTYHGRDPSNRLRYTGRIDKGRRAITHFRVIESFSSDAKLVECRLETGRTHQIRMHFYDANNPVLGDSLYGGRSTGNTSIIDRQALHARSLGFEHPASGETMRFESPYPPDFADALEALERGQQWRS